MATTSVQLFKILKPKMGELEADALITFMENRFDDNNKEIFERALKTFATKEDLAKVKGELEVRIAEVKSDVIRWMFAFFVTTVLLILGLYLKK